MKKIISILLTILITLVSVSPAMASDTDVSTYIDKIFDYYLKENNVSDIQSLVDKLAEKPAAGNEWIIMSIRNYYSNLDYSVYREALEKYVEENTISIHTTKQRLALTLKSINSSSQFINTVCNESTGKAGIISWVFGLHLVNNNVGSLYTGEQILNEILTLQSDDGGWSIYGTSGDPDVTAMVLQSFAPYKNNEIYKDVINNAVNYLASVQLQNGGYSSYGQENSETVASVIMALSSLGIDINDNRFIKEQSLLENLLSFQLEDGSFSHVIGGDSNKTSTAEALYALVALNMYAESGNSYYVFPSLSETPIERTIIKETKSFNYKLILYAIVAVYVVISLLIFIIKKKKAKSLISTVIIAAIAVACISFINIKTETAYYTDDTATGKEIFTTISINCETVKGEKDFIPQNGIILQYEPVAITEGETAYDQLVKACKEHKIHIETDAGSYVNGINYIYEFDFGDLSGWMFKINGNFSDKGCSEIKLVDSDYVEWIYTKNIGKDIGNNTIGE